MTGMASRFLDLWQRNLTAWAMQKAAENLAAPEKDRSAGNEKTLDEERG